MVRPAHFETSATGITTLQQSISFCQGGQGDLLRDTCSISTSIGGRWIVLALGSSYDKRGLCKTHRRIQQRQDSRRLGRDALVYLSGFCCPIRASKCALCRPGRVTRAKKEQTYSDSWFVQTSFHTEMLRF